MSDKEVINVAEQPEKQKERLLLYYEKVKSKGVKGNDSRNIK